MCRKRKRDKGEECDRGSFAYTEQVVSVILPKGGGKTEWEKERKKIYQER